MAQQLREVSEFCSRIFGMRTASEPHHHPRLAFEKVFEEFEALKSSHQRCKVLGTGQAERFVAGQTAEVGRVLRQGCEGGSRIPIRLGSLREQALFYSRSNI